MDSSLLATMERIKANLERKTKNSNVAADADALHNLIDNTVTKQHALSRAYYRFGLVEKRCMEAMISKLNPMRHDNVQEIELKVLDYAKAFQVSDKIAYRDLASAVHGLMRTVITADRPNGKKGRIEFTLMSKAEYMEDEGRILCVFNPLVVPYLMGLKEKFSSYPLKNAVDFSSSYTWRFYELLVSWAKDKKETDGLFVGWFTPSVEELREMLGVPPSYKWESFNRQVLVIAERELREKASIHMDITRIKTSRKITHLKIEFIQSDQIPIPLAGGELPKKPRKGKA